MKRFFTKKSVAYIFITILLFGLFSFNFASAATAKAFSTSTIPAMINAPAIYVVTDLSTNYKYNYEGGQGASLENKWKTTSNGGREISSDELASILGINSSNPIFSEAKAVAKPFADKVAAEDNARLKEQMGLLGSIFVDAGNLLTGAANLASFAAWSLTLMNVQIIVSVFTAISGVLFDLTMSFSIINIKTLFDNGGVLNILWVLVRDTMNVCFIIILLYLAIVKILNGWGAKAKTTIMNLIVSVILINFSMFITKFFIDAGNMIAVALYNQLSISGGGTIGMVTSLSTMIFKGTGILTTIKSVLSITGQTNIIVSLILQITAMCFLLWTFFYSSILLIGRAVMLMFLTIISPIGFIGKTIPGLSGFSDWWWKTLTDQIMVAPVLMFFLFFIIKLINAGVLNNTAKESQKGLPNIDVGGIFVYILIIVLLLQALKITKKLSGEVGDMTVKVGKLALAAGAFVATGGAAGVTGALSGGLQAGMTAFKTGGLKAGLSAAGSHIQGGLKDVMEKPGVTGFATRSFTKNIKTTTGLDIEGLQKNLEKSTKEEKERLATIANKGVKAAGIEKTQLDKKQEMINDAGDTALSTGEIRERAKAKKDLDYLAEHKKKAEEEYEHAKDSGSFEDEMKAESVLNITTADFSKAEAKVKSYEDKEQAAREKMAKEIGVELETAVDSITGEILKDREGKPIDIGMDKLLESNRQRQVRAREEKNTFINEQVKNGSFLKNMLNKKDRDELAESLIADTYSSIDKKKLKKDMEEFFGIGDEKQKTTPPTPKPETK